MNENEAINQDGEETIHEVNKLFYDTFGGPISNKEFWAYFIAGLACILAPLLIARFIVAHFF